LPRVSVGYQEFLLVEIGIWGGLWRWNDCCGPSKHKGSFCGLSASGSLNWPRTVATSIASRALFNNMCRFNLCISMNEAVLPSSHSEIASTTTNPVSVLTRKHFDANYVLVLGVASPLEQEEAAYQSDSIAPSCEAQKN